MAQRTLTEGPGDRRSAGPIIPVVVRVLQYDRPHDTASRHELDELDEIAFGRGEQFVVQRANRSARIVLEDGRMSGTHARMFRDQGGWTIEDLGSRNGSFVNGVRITRATLAVGSIVELGRTAFVFCMGQRWHAADLTAEQVAAPLPGIPTFSTVFASRLEAAARLARSTQSLVLHGETGTGKEVIARGIHAASGRTGAFVALNCAALPPNLIESELFGFRKGAFSGAVEDRLGLVRSADAGTLLLDEVGDLPLATQASLLRVLQEREVLPIGTARPIPVDVRVLAASHRDLEQEVSAGRFREDLLARLAGYTVVVPPLRERKEDLGLLLARLLARLAPANTVRLSPRAGYALMRYGWPRNVRELEQVLATAIALADGTVEMEHLSLAIQHEKESPAGDDLAPSEVRRREELVALLASHKGNVAAVARAMGVARMQIHRWVERYGISIDAFRGS